MKFQAFFAVSILILYNYCTLASEELADSVEYYTEEELPLDGVKSLSIAPRRGCEAGKFYKHEDFFAELTSTFIYDNPETFVPASLHCAAAFLNYGFLTEKCACDCFYEHGASESAACVLDLENLNRAPIGCACLYTDEDRKRIPCLGKLPPGEVTNLSVPPRRQRIFDNSRISKCEQLSTGKQKHSCLRDTCAQAYDGVKVAVCSNEEFLLSNNKTIRGVDVCAVDCFYIHGSRKQPYGVCSPPQEENDGRSVCTCLY